MNRSLYPIRWIFISVFSIASVAAQTADIASLQRSAKAGDPKAQFDLAQAYFEGNGVPRDQAKGLDWLRKSASQSYAGAEITLGVLYQNGVQVAKDPHEAAKWYRRAARQSDKDPKHAQKAQEDLGILASQGLISVSEADWRSAEPGSGQTQAQSSGDKNSGKVKAAPFSLAEVETGLTGGITAKRMATLVSQYGVDFSMNDSAKQRLTSDGADDTLLQTIASSKR